MGFEDCEVNNFGLVLFLTLLFVWFVDFCMCNVFSSGFLRLILVNYGFLHTDFDCGPGFRNN